MCRAIIPAAGYFEFKGKRPFYFHSPDNETLAMAGLYSWWRANAGSLWLLTATVMTCAATGDAAKIHDRMPLLVAQDMTEQWLDRNVDGSAIISDIHNEGLPISKNLDYYETAEPKQGEDGPRCVQPLEKVVPLSLF
ncbi:SOS response-associated peptidase family protein [Bifidobacterium sp. ESL0798]|uniref:SOS response-associated peptidase family protein n=1 Tax=Bifidobacterium sp. ESL0798 TaxID=2983235 RepID=UPI0023F65A21|nr:SOS response-associated peptidase family protein [Bifidobacterium sp. ESL0798]WEV73323.1 SOS response-associated peptidase family protein [Bifidobacterium sp. ESL0798]